MINDNMLEINSSVIQAIHWNPNTLVLTIRFHSGELYEYYEVSGEDFADLFFSGSVGQAFAKHKHKFEYEKLT